MGWWCAQLRSFFCGGFKTSLWGFPVKNPPASAGDPRDKGLIPQLGRSPGEGSGNSLAWRIPWTEEPRGLHSMGLQRDMTEHTGRLELLAN